MTKEVILGMLFFFKGEEKILKIIIWKKTRGRTWTMFQPLALALLFRSVTSTWSLI